MNTNPLVSIVIPTYNQQEDFLRECIESAINQTYTNIEIIISDNHSDNGAAKIIAGYAQTDTRIRVVKPPAFLSLIDNFIFAYNEVRGEYICPVSSDDILYPEIVEEQLTPFFTYPDISFCYSKPVFFKDDIKNVKWEPGNQNTGFYQSDNFAEFYITYRDISWGGILLATKMYQKIGGFSNEYKFAGDVDLFVKLILLGKGVYYLNKPLSAVRLWVRQELEERIPYQLAENAKIFDSLHEVGRKNKNTSLIEAVKIAKRNCFAPEVFHIPYMILRKKRPAEILEREVTVIKQHYPNGFLGFIINNRKNIIGLGISVGFLTYSKFKNFIKKKP